MKRIDLTIKDLQEINRLYDSGMTVKEVATTLNFTKGRIVNYIWNPRHKGVRTDDDRLKKL